MIDERERWKALRTEKWVLMTEKPITHSFYLFSFLRNSHCWTMREEISLTIHSCGREDVTLREIMQISDITISDGLCGNFGFFWGDFIFGGEIGCVGCQWVGFGICILGFAAAGVCFRGRKHTYRSFGSFLAFVSLSQKEVESKLERGSIGSLH